MKRLTALLFLLIVPLIVFFLIRLNEGSFLVEKNKTSNTEVLDDDIFFHPLQIGVMRRMNYSGSELIIEDSLSPKRGYKRYIASYLSEGLRIKGLLTIPTGEIPNNGWPAVVFNHGYIKPESYRREEKYIAYIDGFAREGFIVFMPDYRGHQDSEGEPLGAYFSPAYTTDSLNAFYSLKKLRDPDSASLDEKSIVDKSRMGMWGHSMGGNITLRSMVISKDIKAGVIWAGVVASYSDMSTKWRRSEHWTPSERENMSNRPGRADLEKEYGSVIDNETFWNSISPINFVSDISGPVQLHHGIADNSVPWEFSQSLKDALEDKDKTVEYYLYENGDHNLSGNSFSPAMKRSVEFFKKYL